MPDPRKTDAGKLEIPRGADGKPLKWIEGMATCRCGINGGKHLFKDCPKAAEKKKEKAKKALAAELAKKAADATSGSAEAEMRAALASILMGLVPAVNLTGGEAAASESK